MTTLTGNDPRIDFCILSLQSAGIETDWDAFRTFVATNPSATAIADKTETLMRLSGFGYDEIALFAASAAADIQHLVNALATQQQESLNAAQAPTTAPPTGEAPVAVQTGDPITLDEALMLLIIHEIRHGLTVYKTPIPDKYTLDNKADVHNSTWAVINQHAFTISQIRGISSRDAVLAALAVVSDTATPDQRRTLAAWLDTNPNLPGETTTYQWNTANSDQHATDITNLRRRSDPNQPSGLNLALRTVRSTKRNP